MSKKVGHPVSSFNGNFSTRSFAVFRDFFHVPRFHSINCLLWGVNNDLFLSTSKGLLNET